MMRVGNEMVVSIRFAMKNSRGEVLEDRMEGDPVVYLHGGDAVDVSLQRQVEGMEVGERGTVYWDDVVCEVVIDGIRSASVDELASGRPVIEGGLRVYVLSGFLGSGKTTAIREVCRLLLEAGRKVAVITNDQGSRLVDGGLFRSLGIASRQVVNGCFCCHYHDLDESIRSLQSAEKPEMIFAESVGSCTDIVATVLNPLSAYRRDVRTAFTVFAEGPLLLRFLSGEDGGLESSVLYIYGKQLEEAGLLVVSKIDLMRADELSSLKELVGERMGGKIVLWQNSYKAEDILRWLRAMDEMGVTGLRAPEIDYAIYGSGEARLAWLDQELAISGPGVARKIAEEIYARVRGRGYVIGHLKFLVNGSVKISAGAQGLDEAMVEDLVQGSLLINARVQTEPAVLYELVQAAIAAVRGAVAGCSIETVSERHFQPGFPRPTYRIVPS